MKNPSHKYYGEIKESLAKHEEEKRFLKETLSQYESVNRNSIEKIKSLERELSLIPREKEKIRNKLLEFSAELLKSKTKAASRALSQT